MAKAIFLFTPFGSSFKVHVENLESLCVEDIQEIEKFVLQRKGVFDFSTYSFIIQKKIDFFEFEFLIKNSTLNAHVINKPIFKEEKRVGFGQYKGMTYKELPDSYIIWLKTNYIGKEKSTIEKEYKKRKL